MAHKSAVSMYFMRAGLTIVSYLSPLQNAVNAAFLNLKSSIVEQTGNRKVCSRTKGFDCDVAHYATYYSVISKRILAILWYFIPKYNVIACVNRTAHAAGAVICIGFMGRSGK